VEEDSSGSEKGQVGGSCEHCSDLWVPSNGGISSLPDKVWAYLFHRGGKSVITPQLFDMYFYLEIRLMHVHVNTASFTLLHSCMFQPSGGILREY